ncbi:hypothetical protein COT97_01050 [Candidatus Falkowbacteria bacterium CG10_big_fil_rev_8_21_14_0_10_39_11]|uniref:Leucine-rich repeat domain-containing protein n=1 Tax=Candidatus Falkowbacteria bacterium CG10_big_fil_rev_8_21_14_0_10_39_11 TaxID=1974565 RepID=A0A2H0V5Y5_9BACT|nr:MAG: hypothetical protein COT97_01050 [Candidatus Falkowbacteria bacterium CG10_big_fil_rev_8_21_14_0_10_39_11]
MPIERQNLRKILATVSNYKFEDIARQDQYKKLSLELESIISENGFDVIWENHKLLVLLTEKLDMIINLYQEQELESKAHLWSMNDCVQWLQDIGVKDPETKVSFVDRGIVISGNLNLEYSPVRELPPQLFSVGESLELRGSQVRRLPDTLIFIGLHLDLADSLIQELPSGLSFVGGSMNLKDSKIQSLPDALHKIGKHLYLQDSLITDIPYSLEIEGNVYAKGCPQALIDKLRGMKLLGKIKGLIKV